MIGWLIAVFLIMVSPARAQCVGAFPPSYVCGNGTGSTALPDAIPFAMTGLSDFVDWTNFTPTLTSSGGTLGTYSIVTAYYTKEHKTVHFFINVTITSSGTSPSGNVLVTLPVNPTTSDPFVGTCFGIDEGLGGHFIGGPVLSNGANTANLTYNDGGFAGANGAKIVVFCTYNSN